MAIFIAKSFKCRGKAIKSVIANEKSMRRDLLYGVHRWTFNIHFYVLLLQFMQAAAILFLLRHGFAEEDSTTPVVPSSGTTFGALFRQARSENFYSGRYSPDESESPSSSFASPIIAMRSEPLIEHRDSSYYDARCITCDPNKSSTSSIVPVNERE